MLSNPFPGFPPLSLGYIAALTPDHWDVEIIDENFDVATFRECDLVGITGFTAMANRAYQVARMFRDKGVPVVMGGIHASMMPDEALKFVDAVVIGPTRTSRGRRFHDATCFTKSTSATPSRQRGGVPMTVNSARFHNSTDSRIASGPWRKS
jgi:hypothetical protein